MATYGLLVSNREISRSTIERQQTPVEHGISFVAKDPSVTPERRRGLALGRSLVLVTLVGAFLALFLRMWDVRLEEVITDSSIALTLDFCSDAGPTLSGSGVKPTNFLNLMSRRQIKVMTFQPEGLEAMALGLPNVTFFESEEFYAATREKSMGYSFGTFKVNEMLFRVRAGNARLDPRRCLEILSRSRGLDERAGNDTEVVADFFGEAVVAALRKAKRRVPQDWLMTTPRVHGALLLWRGPEHIWSQALGEFTSVYEPSPGWLAFKWTVMILRVSVTAGLLFIAFKFLYVQWERSLEIWVVQYDHLWDHVSRGEPHRSRHHHNPDLLASMKHRFQACSLFFIFDHILGNPERNSEDVHFGLASAALHAGMIIGPCLLPMIHSMFFVRWKALCWVLVVSHLVLTAAYGVTYYIRMSLADKPRRILFWMHILVLLLLVSYGTLYLCSIVLFMASRLIVDPADICGYAMALGTVIVVAGVAVGRMHKLREGIVRQLEGHSSRGETIKFLHSVGLDFRTIVCTVGGLVLLVLGVAAMAILVGQLYFESQPLPDLLTSCFTPLAGLVATAQTLQKKREEWKTVATQIRDATLNTL